MDGANAHKIQSPLNDLALEQDKLDSSTARYLTRVKPFSLRFDVSAPLMTQELAVRWPVESGKEQQASSIRHQIENYLKPLIEHIHPGAVLRMVVNVGSNPEGQVPLPDAPAFYAAFDVSRGTIRHHLAAANEAPLNSWAENISRGMTLLCQPIDNKTEQFAQALGQGGNLYALESVEQNETEDWRRAHNRSIIVPMMPPYAKSDMELASHHHYQEAHKSDVSGHGTATLVGAGLPIGEDVKEQYNEQASGAAPANVARNTATVTAEAAHKLQKENDDRIAEENKADSEAMAQKNMDDEATQTEEAAMQRVEFLLNEVKRDERLIRENPQLSTELDELMGSAEQLRGTPHDGPMGAQAEADINNAQTEVMLDKESETSYDESSNPEQIFMGMPEKETEVQESEQAREDSEHFPEEITQVGEYARIADLNPDAAAELTAEEPGLEHAAVREDFLPAGADMLNGNSHTAAAVTDTAAADATKAAAEEARGSGSPTTVSEATNAANEVTRSPQAAAEREIQTAPAATASRAAQEIGGATEAPPTVDAALESRIDEPTTSPTTSIEQRELSGGAPVNAEDQPVQDETPLARAEAREQINPPPQELPAQDPFVEQAKEQIKDEMMREPEPAQTNASTTAPSSQHIMSAQHAEAAGNVETAATPHEIAPHLSPQQSRATSPAENPATEIAKEGMRGDVFQSTEPNAQYTSAFDRASANVNAAAEERATAAPQNFESGNQQQPEFIQTNAPHQNAPQQQASAGVNENISERAREEAFEPAENGDAETAAPRETATAQNHEFDLRPQPASAATNARLDETSEPLQSEPSTENPGAEIAKEGIRDEVFRSAEPDAQYTSAFDRASANINAAAQKREMAAPQNFESGNQQQSEFIHTNASQQNAPRQQASDGASEPISERAREQMFEPTEQKSTAAPQSKVQVHDADPSTTFQREPAAETVRAKNTRQPAASRQISNTAEPSRFSGEPISNVTERSSAYAENHPSESVQQTEAPDPTPVSAENASLRRETPTPTTAKTRAETPATSLAAQPTATVPVEPNAIHTMQHMNHIAEALDTGGGFTRAIRRVPQALTRVVAKTGLVKAKVVAAAVRPARQVKAKVVAAAARPARQVKAKVVAAAARRTRQAQPVKTRRAAQATPAAPRGAPTAAKIEPLHRPNQTTEPHSEAPPEAAPK